MPMGYCGAVRDRISDGGDAYKENDAPAPNGMGDGVPGSEAHHF